MVVVVVLACYWCCRVADAVLMLMLSWRYVKILCLNADVITMLMPKSVLSACCDYAAQCHAETRRKIWCHVLGQLWCRRCRDANAVMMPILLPFLTYDVAPFVVATVYVVIFAHSCIAASVALILVVSFPLICCVIFSLCSFCLCVGVGVLLLLHHCCWCFAFAVLLLLLFCCFGYFWRVIPVCKI